MPYVAERKSHDPVRSQDIWMSVKREAVKIVTDPMVEFVVDFDSLDAGRPSWQRRMSGGRSSMGYMERYDAIARANMLVNCAPTTALEMACKIAHVVKT